MTDVIERVARAIFEASPPDLGRGPLASAPPLARRIAHEQACAAIAAMREPSREMIAAGEEVLVRLVDVDEAALWRAMVDAALNGEPCTPPVANDDYRQELESVMRTLNGMRAPAEETPARPDGSAPLMAALATVAAAAAGIVALTLLYWAKGG